MELLQNPRQGFAFLTEGGDIDEIARALNTKLLLHLPPSGKVAKARGAAKAFSFHWSNAQKAWDVISVRSFPWGIDGAEFILFVGRNAVSPTGKLWALPEMRYVAKKLRNHPGYAWAVKGSQQTGNDMSTLRKALIRLAHQKPEMRPHLLPLLKRASPQITVDFDRGLFLKEIPKDPHGQVYDAAFPLDKNGKRIRALAETIAKKNRTRLVQMRLYDATKFIDAEVSKVMPGKRIRWHHYSMPD